PPDLHSLPTRRSSDLLLLLQHRGQDAASLATWHDQFFSMHKAYGLVRDVFRTRNMRSLPGNSGIGHVRYPTAGSSDSVDEAQPLDRKSTRLNSSHVKI